MNALLKHVMSLPESERGAFWEMRTRREKLKPAGFPIAYEDISHAEERFRAKVIKGESCWTLKGQDHGGYAYFAVDRKTYGAHRLAYAFANKGCPAKQVLHKCDYPSCVNPDHLFIGTAQDNMDDMVAKGRAGWLKQSTT